MPKAALIMGSKSDFESMKGCIDTLKEFGVDVDIRVLSAHRTPDATAEFAKSARANGYGVLLCAAGKAAHLGGVIAAYTTLPVVGIPVRSTALDGMDALLSMIQMPPGIPVGVMAIDGAVNAALYAVQILSGAYPALVTKLESHRDHLRRLVEDGDRWVREQDGR